ncbi:MAG: type II secretion system protein GspG, partial [Candidatus Sumerlaeia bacterium]|nr:type II secretion system protein GspG [Candidatus Sumerlaeia bacterium]
LIVVAIIAILAAIAVPNFLEAQTRAKVSRAKADMRSLTTAIEAYAIDYNQLPPPFEAHATGAMWGTLTEPPFHSRIGTQTTTPVAYITSLPFDPFANQSDPMQSGFLTTGAFGGGASHLNMRFIYWNVPYFAVSFVPTAARVAGGSYILYSPGPDRNTDNGNTPPYTFYRPYDPTNGTISQGNIFRSQKVSDGIDYAAVLAL